MCTGWEKVTNIEILGNLGAERLSIVSFVVRAPSGRYLHHNFVVAVLNDLFGIQSRGGCSCAGPYGHSLLGIDLDRSHDGDDVGQPAGFADGGDLGLDRGPVAAGAAAGQTRLQLGQAAARLGQGLVQAAGLFGVQVR